MLQVIIRLIDKCNLSLAVLLAICFSALGLILTGGMAIVADRVATPQIQEDVGKRLAAFTVEIQGKLDRALHERWLNVQAAASMDVIRDPGSSPDQKRSILERLQASDSSYAIVGLIDAKGNVLATSAWLGEDKDVPARESSQKRLSTPYAGDLYDAGLLAKIIPQPGTEPLRFIDIAAPVLGSDGLPIGAVIARLDWRWAEQIESALFNSTNRAKTQMLILTANGTVLLGPLTLRGERLDLESVKQAQAGGTGSTKERWPDGRFYLTGYSPAQGHRNYPGLRWTVLMRRDLDVALAAARQIRQRIILASLAAGVVAVLFSSAVGWLVTFPLRKLTAAARGAQRSSSVIIPVVGGYAEVNSLSLSLADLFHERQLRENTLVEALVEARLAEKEARAQERSFRLLFRANPVPMYVASLTNLKFLSVNGAAEEFYGYTRDEFSSI